MQLFLNARHWQIAVMQAIPILCVFFLRGVLSPLQTGFMWALLIAVMVAWLYSIGSNANERVPEALKMNPRVMQVTTPASVCIFVIVLIIMYKSSQAQVPPPPWLIYVLFVGLGAFFYTLWFAARQFVTAEKGAETFYIEYAFPMLGFWFGFVGAWFLQPRVNRMLGDSHAA